MGNNEKYLARLGRELDRIQAFAVTEYRTPQQMEMYQRLGLSQRDVERNIHDALAYKLAQFLLSKMTIAKDESRDGTAWAATVTVVVPEGVEDDKSDGCD